MEHIKLPRFSLRQVLFQLLKSGGIRLFPGRHCFILRFSLLRRWIRRHFRALGKDIDSRLCGEMIELCGDLMQNLQQEIEKIAAYAKGGQITRADIEAVATPQESFSPGP